MTIMKIAVAGGGNDCDQDERQEAAEIVRNYGKLIDIAKEKAKEVTVSRGREHKTIVRCS